MARYYYPSWYPDQPLFVALEPVLLDRDSLCLCILAQFLAMYALGAVASLVLPIVSPRVTTLPARRRQQLEVAMPVIAFKATLMALLIDTLLASPGSIAASQPRPSVEYRFQTLFFLALSYVFELLQRPSSAELVLHHLYLQGLPLYYWFWLRSRPQARCCASLSSWRCWAPARPTLPRTSRFCCTNVPGGREAGWRPSGPCRGWPRPCAPCSGVVLTGYGWAQFGEVRLLLSPLEKGTFVVSVVLWAWTELDEILKIRGMVGFRASLAKKSESSDAHRE
jgi:hypothetical protein